MSSHGRCFCHRYSVGQRRSHLCGEAGAKKSLLSVSRKAGSVRKLKEVLPRHSPCAKFAQGKASPQFCWGLSCGLRRLSCSCRRREAACLGGDPGRREEGLPITALSLSITAPFAEMTSHTKLDTVLFVNHFTSLTDNPVRDDTIEIAAMHYRAFANNSTRRFMR